MLKPILFNTEMVRAIQEGRKTVTRRIVKTNKRGMLIKPYEVGDVLWVRETWDFLPCISCGVPCVNSPQDAGWVQFGKRPDTMETADGLTDGCFLYRADGETPVFSTGYNWRPSIHMPRQAARIFLRVTGVRAEQLQESINEAAVPIMEIYREGIPIYEECRVCKAMYGRPYCIDQESECGLLDQPRFEFSRLWDSTIPKDRLDRDGWEANPRVWVIRFEVCEKPAGWPC